MARSLHSTQTVLRLVDQSRKPPRSFFFVVAFLTLCDPRSLGIHQIRSFWICHRRYRQGHRAQPETDQGTTADKSINSFRGRARAERLMGALTITGILPTWFGSHSYSQTQRSYRRLQTMCQTRPEQPRCEAQAGRMQKDCATDGLLRGY